MGSYYVICKRIYHCDTRSPKKIPIRTHAQIGKNKTNKR